MDMENINTIFAIILSIITFATLLYNFIQWWAGRVRLKKYLGQSFFIQPDYSKEPNGSDRKNLFKDMKAALRDSNPKKYFFILGDFGTGKTFFLYYLYCWLRKRQWHSGYKVKMVHLVRQNFDVEVKNVSEEEQGKCILLLDGFDEDHQARSDIQKRFHDILVATQGYKKVVLTSRLNFWQGLDPKTIAPFIPEYQNIREFIYLAPFSDRQVKEYLRKKFWPRNTRRLYVGIHENRWLNEISFRPLLLSYMDDELLAGMGNESTEPDADRDYQNYGQKNIIRRIYDILARKNFVRKDGAFFENNQEGFDQLMAVIAYDMLANERTISIDGFEDYYWEKIRQYYLNITFNHEYIRTIREEAAAVEDRTLLVKVDDNIVFCHRSFAEYYAALCIERFYLGADRMDFTIPTHEVGAFICFEKNNLRFIPGGKFMMGEGTSKREVEVDSFFMGICPVTNLEYERFDPEHKMRRKYSSAGDEPVIYVSWNDANRYCEWLSKKTGRTCRLPSETEWEYACRAGSAGLYSLGIDGMEVTETNLKDYAVYNTKKTMPVGRCKPNFFGLYDMHGNVWEWCRDYDMKKPVLRGGSWSDGAVLLRSASRSYDGPDGGYGSIGFRVVMVAQS